MIRNIFRAAALAVAASATLTFAAPQPAQAITVTVPNYFECSYTSGKCVQQNGAYVRSVPTVCRGVFRYIAAGNRNPSLCDRWI